MKGTFMKRLQRKRILNGSSDSVAYQKEIDANTIATNASKSCHSGAINMAALDHIDMNAQDVKKW